ncbi:SgcJ/EcaC family oxidoreductase [Ponticaulis sp.]|uniref:YybH family protein n=1 Tax=Ponticaulis sp. TaxID=2020902 RepID=UPI0026084D29|nr:SgcJ/EcaC family oxidoreductase [Ponticaulis sp.]MDF1680685.1 SgcJ/EcaC family oxidoreductase [Ponticaulis sp.]
MNKTVFLMLAIAVSGFVSGCSETPSQADDEANLVSATQTWVETYNRNDWAALADLFTTDAVMMPPGSPAVTGREAIVTWEATYEEGFRIALHVEHIDVIGDHAIIRGRSCLLIPLDDGKTGVDVGKYLEVRIRSADGRWLVEQDIFNSSLSPGTELVEACPFEADF